MKKRNNDCLHIRMSSYRRISRSLGMLPLLLGLLPQAHAFAVGPWNGRQELLSLLTATPGRSAVVCFRPRMADANTLRRRTLLHFAGAALTAPRVLSAVPAEDDLIHPASLVGEWQCQRLITSIEGNSDEALRAWQALNGGGSSSSSSSSTRDILAGRRADAFLWRFLPPPPSTRSEYLFEGESLRGVIIDRRFEIASREPEAIVKWDPRSPGALSYTRPGSRSGAEVVELVVVQRKIEMPSEKGWGGSELVQIVASGRPLPTTRVQRRFRRAFDADGNRVVEGLEIVKTYRSPDANDRPTSITKAQLRMTRPAVGSVATEEQERD